MKILKYVSILFIALAFIVGCSGTPGKLKTQSEDDSKVIRQELVDNWSEYGISYNTTVLVFDPKNDGKKIVVDNYWSTVEDQETWTEVVRGTETLPNRNISQAWGNEIREIWVRSQFYGYVTNQPRELVSAHLVDENTVRLIHNYGLYGGGP